MRFRRAAAVLIVGAVSVTSLAGPTSAASQPVSPEFFGVHNETVESDDSGAWASARMWGAWCTVQPTAETEVNRGAADALGGAYSTYARNGISRLTVSLGHPSAWVFNDNAKAQATNNSRVWFCERSAANTSFPTVATLRSGPVLNAYSAYVAAVVSAAGPYLAANPANKLVLQAWNEPNLKNGGTVTNKIPGAARTWTQAAESLREQERIMRRVAASLIPGRFEITSPSMYGKKTSLNTHYFAAQGKSRTVDSISLNFYTLRQSKVNHSISLWRKKAAVAKKLVTRHKKLRNVPIWLTETNHNLINFISSGSNLNGVWARPETQRRLVEVTTMEALRQRYAGIQWYQGTPAQTAVNTRPGSLATQASKALRDELNGRRLIGCSTKRTVTTCTMSERPGSGRIKVRWSSTGTTGVTILS